MEIKRASGKRWRQVIQLMFERSRFFRLILVLFLAVILLLIGIYIGIVIRRPDVKTFIREVAAVNINIVPHFFQGLLAQTDHLVIDITHEDYQKLAFKREQALVEGGLVTSSDDFVSAEITHNGEQHRVKVRLKGDNRDHWEDPEKWSLRVRVSSSDTILGMKQFSIQKPATRGYINEWLFHKLLSYNQLIPLRYDFITITINGKNLGLYAIEEHFEKRLLESNGFREGPIVRLKGDEMWQEFPANIKDFSISTIDAFQTSIYEEDAMLGQQFLVAKNLLEAFKFGELAMHEVFDVEKVARLFAVIDLMGQAHVIHPENIRWYYNPVTSRLEPLGYDNQLIEPTTGLLGMGLLVGASMEETIATSHSAQGNMWNSGLQGWHDLFFADQVFFEKYIAALREVSEPDYLDSFFESIQGAYKEAMSVIYKDKPFYHSDARTTIETNQSFINKALNQTGGIRVYRSAEENESNRVFIALNFHRLPFEVLGILIEDELYVPDTPVVLQPRQVGQPVSTYTISFPIPPTIDQELLLAGQLIVRIIGDVQSQSVHITQDPLIDEKYLNQSVARRAANVHTFKFVQERDDVFTVRQGTWVIDKTLVVPVDSTLVVPAGTTLDIQNEAFIVSSSPVHFMGTEDSPVVVRSSDGRGQGMIVLDTKRPSLITHTRFEGLAPPKEDGWELSGAVNFYETSVDIAHSQFVRNRSGDDALNIIRSSFSITDNLFQDTYADAIDLDFATGTIADSLFKNIGAGDGNGDALDLSGSTIIAEGLEITGVSDKGISVGENSEATFRNITILDAQVGLAVKDWSRVDIRDSSIANSDTGLAIYQKKSEFGPALVLAYRLVFTDVVSERVIEEGSVFQLNGEIFSGTDHNLADSF